MTPEERKQLIDDELKARWWDRLMAHTKSLAPSTRLMVEHEMTVVMLTEGAIRSKQHAELFAAEAIKNTGGGVIKPEDIEAEMNRIIRR
jgi:hypothetical protein